jgi:adenylate cyclase
MIIAWLTSLLNVLYQIMREGIGTFGGYEIATEGDAFQIAFPTVAQAVHFCLETQYRLLDTKWPRELLRLPQCREERSASGEPIFRGLRVRMGIHYAVEGTLAHR